MSNYLSEQPKAGSFDPDAKVDVPDWFWQYLRAALSQPMKAVPKPFETWMVDRPAVHGVNIPAGQILGFNRASLAALVGMTSGSPQSIANNTFTALAFPEELFDPGGMHDVSTNNTRLTCVNDGFYMPYAYVAFASNSTGDRGCRVLKNGGFAYTGGFMLPAAVGQQFQLATTFPPLTLMRGDYLTIEVYQQSGGNLNALDTCQFGMSRIASSVT